MITKVVTIDNSKVPEDIDIPEWPTYSVSGRGRPPKVEFGGPQLFPNTDEKNSE